MEALTGKNPDFRQLGGFPRFAEWCRPEASIIA